MDGYYVGQVATATHLHEAITASTVDDELVDHTGDLLGSFAGCSGMGLPLAEYPPAVQVLEAHAGHLARQAPTVGRFAGAAVLADHLANTPLDRLGVLAGDARRLASVYTAVLDREDWSRTAREYLDPADEYGKWLITGAGARLRLAAFTDYYD